MTRVVRLFSVGVAVNFAWEMAQMSLYAPTGSWVQDSAGCLGASLGDGRNRAMTTAESPPRASIVACSGTLTSRHPFHRDSGRADVEIDTITNTANNRYLTGRRTRAFIIDDHQA